MSTEDAFAFSVFADEQGKQEKVQPSMAAAAGPARERREPVTEEQMQRDFEAGWSLLSEDERNEYRKAARGKCIHMYV